MIYFINLTCCKAYLIAVRGIACRCRCDNFALRKLALHCFAYRLKRICRTCNAHCGVNIRTPRKRISYCSAYAGCRTAERLYFCRVIVCFVFEEKQPRLLNTVDINVYFYGASVYFFGFVKLFQFAALFKQTNGNGCNIHKIYGLRSVCFGSCRDIFFIRFLQKLIFKVYAVYCRKEGCMTAVI